MKKIIALMFALCALLAFVSCGGKDTECEHIDESIVDGVCDKCGENVAPVEPGGFPLVPVA